MFRPDGKKYDGNWSEGKQHGKGLYTNVKGVSREGEWENGKRIKWLDNK